MRVVRILVAAMMTVALSVGLGGVAVGQSPEPLDQMGGAYWTGTWTFIDGSFVEGAESSGPTYTEVLGFGTQATIAADDPRIAGTMTAVANSRFNEDMGVALHHGRARIDNDDGDVGRDVHRLGQPVRLGRVVRAGRRGGL